MLRSLDNVFLTKQDPNYRIKGSRDPLGFQVVWSRAGRELIKYLSTVSINILDFQTLLYGRFIYKYILQGNPKKELNFFYKFEQASAYARYHLYKTTGGGEGDKSFNGAEHVAGNYGEEIFLSTKPGDTLLSNQKAYGIWGKYSRPFKDLGLLEKATSSNILPSAIKEKVDFAALCRFSERLKDEERLLFGEADRRLFEGLYRKLTQAEIVFFRENILQVSDDEHHLQNELYNLLIDKRSLLLEKFHTFDFLKSLLMQVGLSQELVDCLTNIKHTERVLFNLNSFFRILQTQALWTSKDFSNDTKLSPFNENVGCCFKHDDEMNILNAFFSIDVAQTASSLIERNSEVCKKRKQPGWAKYEKGILRMLFREGGGCPHKKSYDNSYFINAYLNLFRQIEGAK